MRRRAASFLPLRWLAIVLLSLLWTTIGNAATMAERGDFGHIVLAAKAPRALRVSPFEA